MRRPQRAPLTMWGSLAHGLCPSDQADATLAKFYFPGTVNHGLEPGTAEAIHGYCRSLDRETGPKSDVTCQINRVRGRLHDIAHHNVTKIIGFGPRPLHCRFRRHNPQVHCRE